VGSAHISLNRLQSAAKSLPRGTIIVTNRFVRGMPGLGLGCGASLPAGLCPSVRCRSPGVSSVAFHAPSPGLRFASLMDMSSLNWSAALAQAQQYIAQGYGWVIDLDLEKFFQL
jgi:hypothetical protein